MGYYDHDGENRPKLSLFIEWLVVLLLWFPVCIGGWLVHFGMNIFLMLAISLIIAVTGACYFTFSKK